MTVCKADAYKKAVESYENGAYDEAKTKFPAIEDYKDSAEYLDHIYVIGAYDKLKGSGEWFIHESELADEDNTYYVFTRYFLIKQLKIFYL